MSDLSDTEQTSANQTLIMQVTSQQEEINAKETELQRLHALLGEHNIPSSVVDARDDEIATRSGLLATSSMPQLTPHCRPSSTSATVIPVSSTLSMTTTTDPSQIATIPTLAGVGGTSNVVYYVPTQSTEPASKVPHLDPQATPDPQSKFDKNLEAKYKGLGPKGSEDLECDPIPPPLADTLNIWFQSTFTNEEIREKLLQVRRPSNALALKPIMINKEVYQLHAHCSKSLGSIKSWNFLQWPFLLLLVIVSKVETT